MKSTLLQRQLRAAFGTSDLRDLEAVLSYVAKAAADGTAPDGLRARLWKLREQVDESYREQEGETAQGAPQPQGGTLEQVAALSFDWRWTLDAELRYNAPQSEQNLRWRTTTGICPWEGPWAALDPALWAAHRRVLEAHQPFRDFEFRR